MEWAGSLSYENATLGETIADEAVELDTVETSQGDVVGVGLVRIDNIEGCIGLIEPSEGVVMDHLNFGVLEAARVKFN